MPVNEKSEYKAYVMAQSGSVMFYTIVSGLVTAIVAAHHLPIVTASHVVNGVMVGVNCLGKGVRANDNAVYPEGDQPYNPDGDNVDYGDKLKKTMIKDGLVIPCVAGVGVATAFVCVPIFDQSTALVTFATVLFTQSVGGGSQCWKDKKHPAPEAEAAAADQQPVEAEDIIVNQQPSAVIANPNSVWYSPGNVPENRVST